MARFADEEDEPINKEIVYDSQEEQDQWPDSQPQNSPEDNSDNIRQPQCPPKECGKQTSSHARFSERDFISTVDASTLPASQSPKSQRTRTSGGERSSTPTTLHSQRHAALNPSNESYQSKLYHTPDIFHFESSDDDVPLQRTILTQRMSSSPTAIENHNLTTTEKQSPLRRALRARKPEQRMPYTLDLMRHRDQFRRRGLKPVHNPFQQPRTHEDDEQYQADEEEVEMDKDEQYVPPKGIGARAPKRHRIHENQENSDGELEIRLLVGRKKFLAPDIPRKIRPPQQVTSNRETSDFEFISDDELAPFTTLPPASPPITTTRYTLQSQSPQGTFTPVSNNNPPTSPISRGQWTSRAIVVPSDSEPSDTTSRPPPRHSPTPSSSPSDTDELERFKKKARGVLPGSFFTVRARTVPKPVIHRTTTNPHAQERKGVAKTKVNSTSKQPLPFTFAVSSSDEDRPQPPRREGKRNFVDLTREEVIQDDFEGWDIEEDLIDRMLNWGGNTGNRSNATRKPRRKERQNHPFSTKKRKRQQRINKYTIPKRNPPTSVAKRGPKLSIVDACDIYKSRTDRAPPQFMKIASRLTQTVEQFGRRKAPSKRLFTFTEEEDQEDVHTVITQWENGTITEGMEQRTWVRPTKPSSGTRTAGSGRSLATGPKKPAIKRPPLAPLREENTSSKDDATRQTVNKFIRPGAPIISIVDGSKSRGRIQQRNAPYYTGDIQGSTRTSVAAKALVSLTASRPDDIATWLRNTKAPSDSAHIHSVDTTVPSPSLPHPRIRKPRRPARRDINKFDKRFRRPPAETRASSVNQLSLDDVWFPNDSTSFTFGVIPAPPGLYLNSNTLMGKRLVSIALKTKPAIENEPRLWDQNEGRVYLDVDVACNDLTTHLHKILDSIDEIRLSGESSFNTIHRQVLTFAEFMTTYLNGLSSLERNDIHLFGSKLLRLTEIAIDRIDGTLLSGLLDLNDQLTLLGLSLLQAVLIPCYQLCILTSHDVSILGVDQVVSALSRRLLQYLLNGGFEPLQQVIRSVKASHNRIECDSILVDIWNTLYHLLHNPIGVLEDKIPSFWILLQSELDIVGTKDGRILDRAWYTIMNVSAVTVFDSDGIGVGVSNRPNDGPTTVWDIVKTIIDPYLHHYTTVQHHRHDAYIRTLFGRCHTLISTWGWICGAKVILNSFYTFFAERRFDNLKTEAFGGFPNIFESNTPLEIQTTDNTFVIFLKLVVSYITQQPSRLQVSRNLRRRDIMRDLDRFVNRITPLRTYQSTFAPLDYIALQNHYCLLLTLYRVAPESSRPSVDRIRDVIDIEKAPAPAQVICMETWKLLAQFQLKNGEEISSIVDWFRVMFRHAMKEYQVATKSTNNEGVAQIKSKVRALESILLKSLQALAEVVLLAADALAILVEDVTSLLVRSSHQLPPIVMNAFLASLNAFFTCVDKSIPAPIQSAIALDEDSQDYGDATFMEEFVAAQEPSAFAINISNISTHVYQLIANLFASANPAIDNLAPIIDTWILGVLVRVRHRLQDWPAFLQYGGEWERLRSTNSRISRTWSPYILSKILSANPSAYFQAQDHFISAWFESIIEPDLTRQHSLTALLLNIDDENTILSNSVFARNAVGVYEISTDALFEARPALIVHALANIGKKFETLLREGDHAVISISKQRYLDYLHRMLTSMKSIYLEMKDTESEDLVQYISLTQHVVGNIIQYCTSFIKEIDRTFSDLPILDYFTNGDTFPQPGSNEIAYAAQRLRGVARKDSNLHFSNATQTEAFWSIKSFLEKSVRNSREREFVEFCILALCEGDEELLDHIATLRTFVIYDIFCEYFRIAIEAPDVGNSAWGYVLPCLTVVRELYACEFESMSREDVLRLKVFMDDLIILMLTIHGVTELIADQCQVATGSLYSVVCARMFDFVIFVDHVVFYTKDIVELRGETMLLERMLNIFRCIAKGGETIPEEKEWVKSVTAERSRENSYMRAAVRREMQILQFDVPNISKTKLLEVTAVLAGDNSKVCIDDVITMYI